MLNLYNNMLPINNTIFSRWMGMFVIKADDVLKPIQPESRSTARSLHGTNPSSIPRGLRKGVTSDEDQNISLS